MAEHKLYANRNLMNLINALRSEKESDLMNGLDGLPKAMENLELDEFLICNKMIIDAFLDQKKRSKVLSGNLKLSYEVCLKNIHKLWEVNFSKIQAARERMHSNKMTDILYISDKVINATEPSMGENFINIRKKYLICG